MIIDNHVTSGARKYAFKTPDFICFLLVLGTFFTLPPLLAAVYSLVVLVYPLLSSKIRSRYKRLIFIELLVLSCATLLLIKPLISGLTILAFSTLVVIVKRLELFTRRDDSVFLLISIFSCILNLIYWNSIVALLYLMLFMAVIFSYTNTIFAKTGKKSFLLKVTVWALPLAVVAFMIAPRIQGPLWNLGVAMGLPITLYEQHLSVEFSSSGESSESSAIESLTALNKIILIAEFDSAVPLKSDLYWRGSVSYSYDQDHWVDSIKPLTRSQRMESAYKNTTLYNEYVDSLVAPVSYTVKVAPNGENWLYAPGIPVKNVQESFISADNQLLSIRPVNEEFTYKTSSYLNAYFRPANAPSVPKTISYPLNHADDLKATARSWLESESIQESISSEKNSLSSTHQNTADKLLDFLTHPPQWFDATPPYSPARLQDWVGQAMLMLQAADVPARLVSGYRGGDLLALTDVIIVREKHRHYWLELWDNQQGWYRLDVLDILKANKKSTANESQKSLQEITSNKSISYTTSPVKNSNNTQNSAKNSWINSIENWLANYQPNYFAPSEPSSSVSNANGEINQTTLLYAGLLLLFVGIWIALFMVFWKKADQNNGIDTAWELLKSSLAKQGFSSEIYECPSQLIKALQQLNPVWSLAACALIEEYMQLTYGLHQNNHSIKIFISKVKRFSIALKNSKSTNHQTVAMG